MKLPIACVRGLEAAPAFHCPSHRREVKLHGIKWESKGNVGRTAQHLVGIGASEQDIGVMDANFRQFIGERPLEMPNI
jgi:hypothetical protein